MIVNLEDVLQGAPNTPREIAEHSIEMALTDAWLAARDLAKYANETPDLFTADIEADLWGVLNALQFAASRIRAGRGATPLPSIIRRVK